MSAIIRTAVASDMDAIALIYAHHVNHGTGTFETEPPDRVEIARRWDDSGDVVAYAYSAQYRARPAYRHTVEDSVYVRVDRLGTGLGKQLLPALITATRACGMHQMIAVIGDSANHPSINLHRRFGFHDAGLLKDVGFKFGRWLDTVLLQRSLLRN
jgi:L-amino acid N-acyltransferase YncA